MLFNVLDPIIISLTSLLAKLDRLYVNVSRNRPGYASKGKSATDLVWITKNEDASEPAKVSTQKWQIKTTEKIHVQIISWRLPSPPKLLLANGSIDRFGRHKARNNTKLTIINFISPHNAIRLEPILDLILGFNFIG